MARVTDRDRGYRRFVRSMASLSGVLPEVTIGIHEAQGNERPDGGATVAEYATYNEFGMGVPERSFLRAPLAKNQDVYAEAIVEGVIQLVTKGEPLARSLGLVGEAAASDCREAIRAGIDPPNAPATIARKGSSKPLVDTGRLRQSITYQVWPKGRPR